MQKNSQIGMYVMGSDQFIKFASEHGQVSEDILQIPMNNQLSTNEKENEDLAEVANRLQEIEEEVARPANNG